MKVVKFLALVAVAFLVGCAAKPIIKGDSEAQQKIANFPKLGQQVHVEVGGLVHLHADYVSRYAFRLTNPISMGFALGKLNVSPQDALAESSLDGVEVFCTTRFVYIDPLTGPHTTACFVPSSRGKFGKVKAAPGSYWFTKDLAPEVDYASVEVPQSQPGKPFKRELVFEGAQDSTLLFSEKIYEVTLDSPNKSRPVLTKVESVPTKINVNGAIINVVAFTANSLTYSVEKYFE
jgi:hypothetical protein